MVSGLPAAAPLFLAAAPAGKQPHRRSPPAWDPTKQPLPGEGPGLAGAGCRPGPSASRSPGRRRGAGVAGTGNDIASCRRPWRPRTACAVDVRAPAAQPRFRLAFTRPRMCRNAWRCGAKRHRGARQRALTRGIASLTEGLEKLEGTEISGAWGWSGRWESNPRHSAWEADVLPLNYARSQTSLIRASPPLPQAAPRRRIRRDSAGAPTRPIAPAPGRADIGGGRSATDVPLANPVRSGRKQP